MKGKALAVVSNKKIRDDSKIDSITKGLQNSYYERIKKLPKKQAYVICYYLSASSTEIQIADKPYLTR